jgi:hypothetical protein
MKLLNRHKSGQKIMNAWSLSHSGPERCMDRLRTLAKKGSLVVCIIISWYYINYTISIAPWRHKKIIDQDVIFYYGYVPATFIYHDLAFQFPSKPGFKGTIWCITTPTGKGIMKMTMGTALLYTPFFAIAHIYTLLTHGLADGYSLYYQMALIWAGVFYFIMGIFLLRKILSQIFTDNVVSIVLIAISLGTNLLNYASWEGAMSHVYSFFVFALAFWAFLKWLNSPSYWITIILGLALGLIVLIRPTNVTFILFLGLYFFLRPNTSYEKWHFIADHKWKLIPVSYTHLTLPTN